MPRWGGGGAPRADCSLHEQLPRVADGVVHAGDDVRLQRLDLPEEVDSSHTTIEGLQAGGGVLRVLDVCPWVLNAGTVMRRVRDESRDMADHLLQLGGLRVNELPMVVDHARQDMLGTVEAAEVALAGRDLSFGAGSVHSFGAAAFLTQ